MKDLIKFLDKYNITYTIDNGEYCKKEIKIERPPLGLTPRWVMVEQRYGAVCAAISRYYNAGKKIPIEWIEEYNELIDEL